MPKIFFVTTYFGQNRVNGDHEDRVLKEIFRKLLKILLSSYYFLQNKKLFLKFFSKNFFLE